MAASKASERRRFDRFETEAKIEFRVTFDIRTKVDFAIQEGEAVVSPKYSALSTNVSAEGLAFQSEKSLLSGDKLLLEVYVPTADKPISMEGEVKWCRTATPQLFDTGVKIITVENNSVEKTISIDPAHMVVWSIVLESVFGNFKHLMLKRKTSST